MSTLTVCAQMEIVWFLSKALEVYVYRKRHTDSSLKIVLLFGGALRVTTFVSLPTDFPALFIIL